MDQPLPRAWFIIGLNNWLAALHALAVRGILTRFSGGLSGYIWAVLIPVSWIAGITLFFEFLGRAAPMSVPLPIFVATGMLPYLIVRQIVTAMLRAERVHRHLITATLARAQDVLTATAVVEAVNAVFLIASIIAIVAAISAIVWPDTVLTVLIAFGLAWALGVSIGRFAAIIARFTDVVIRVVPIVLRPFFWISGIFFISSELPEPVANWLWWNPLLHIIEFLRHGWFGGANSDFVDLRVPVFCCFAFYFASLLLEQAGLKPDRRARTLA